MISVCIATYNGGLHIKAQLESILNQLSDDDEVIISDDGSSDNTIDIVHSLGDNRVKLFYNDSIHGVNGNFNNALSHANGDIIFLSDQDDIWNPDKVEICVKALSDNLCVMHDCEITDGNLNSTGVTLFEQIDAGCGFTKNMLRNTYTGCCMAFNRKLLKKSLPIPSTNLFYHDQWIGLLAEITGNVVFLPYVGMKFRRHGETSSTVATKSTKSLLRKIKSRCALAFALCRRILTSVD